MIARFRERLSGRRDGTLLSLALACELSTATTWAQLDQGWVPLDEGTVAGAAERVLHGALPHVDFTYPYTGALPFLHAAAMKVFGVTLLSSRYALLIAFMFWLPAVWWLAKRASGNLTAFFVTVVAAWWSVAIYSAAMPSWYLLFLATWIVVAIERWNTTGLLRWLAIAGSATGVAIVIKQTGLYLLAGALLGMLFCEQERSAGAKTSAAGRTSILVITALAALAALVLALLGARAGGSGELLELVVPIAALLWLAASREIRLTVPGAGRERALLKCSAVMFGAAVIPVALLAAYYISVGAGRALFAGAVHEGFARVPLLQSAMPSAWSILTYALPVYLLLALEYRAARRWWAPVIAIFAAIALIGFSFASIPGYLVVWYFAMTLVPAGACAAAIAAWRARKHGTSMDPVTLAVAAMMAMFALNQFPYSAANYFAYVAPLAILTAALVASHFQALPRLVLGAVVLAAFASVVLRIGSVHSVGMGTTWWDDNHQLAMPRGGLRVTAADSAQYTEILRIVDAHRGQGAIYAGPELPEVYFLTGIQSPLREVYRFLPAGTTDTTHLSQLIDVSAANIILINHEPLFLERVSPAILEWLAGRYPNSERIGTIEARWK